MSDLNESEVKRLTGLLGSAIKFSGWTQREIEKHHGWSSGSLSRLLSGGIELKLKHVLDVCEVIGFPPERFFHAAYPKADGGDAGAERLQRLLEQLHPHKTSAAALSPAAASQPPVDPADVERMVYSALGKFFSEFGKPSGGSGS